MGTHGPYGITCYVPPMTEPPHSPLQTAARSLHFRTTTPQSPHWLYPPNIYPKCPFPWSNRLPVNLPHPCTQPTHHSKRHPDPISRFSTIHRTVQQTDRPTDRWARRQNMYQHPLIYALL